MKQLETESGSVVRTDDFEDEDLRSLVVETLNREPDANFEQVHAHLRSRAGRSISAVETERLKAAYQNELDHPTGAHRIGAAEASQIEANLPFRLRRTEIAGVLIGVVPFFLHLQTTTPDTVTRGTGEVVKGGVYDAVAMLGGFIALIIGFAAARQAASSPTQRAKHFALAGMIVLLALYQSALGLGLLHKVGLFG
jgi:hypothetical protein